MSRKPFRNMLFFTAMTSAMAICALDGWKDKNLPEGVEGLFLAVASAVIARREYGLAKAAMDRSPPPLPMTSQKDKAATPQPGP